jgi:hypothetical protein
MKNYLFLKSNSKKEKIDYVDELAKRISDEEANKSDAQEFLSALELVLYKKENLKNAYVTARVVETKENRGLRKNITIYNNTQNPISSRDMVSNNEEQVQLHKRFIEGELPNIFIQIRLNCSIRIHSI